MVCPGPCAQELGLVVGAVVWVAILALTGAWPVALIVALGVAFLPYAWVVSRVAAHAKTVRAAWPEVVDAMVSGVRAGTSLPQVLCELADEGPQPLRFAFDAFSRDYSANGRFASALDRMKDEVRDPSGRRASASPPRGWCFCFCPEAEAAPLCGTLRVASRSCVRARECA